MPSPQTVERPPRVPLVLDPQNRLDSTSKDARLVNGFMEKDRQGNGYRLYKRPGLATTLSKSGNGGGVNNWQGDLYSIFGSTIYKNGTSIGTGLNTAGGVYRFESCLGGTPRMVFGNGAAAYFTDGTTVTTIVDADFPIPFVKGWSFLDGTLYVGTTDAALFGSEINDPSTWDPDNVIIAQIEPDFGVAVAKQLVYTVILKTWSGEIFYDAANETGSPLSPIQGAKFAYGCISSDSVQRMGDSLIWASITQEGGVRVIMLDNLKAIPISTAPVERLLTGADFSTVHSWNMHIGGHRFYFLTLVEEDLTLCYDLQERLWSQWTDSDGHYFPIVSSTYNSDNQPVLQHETDGKLYIADSDYYNDAGALFSVDLYTPTFDADVFSRVKELQMLYYVGDRVPGAELQIRTNDWDYAPDKWTNFRTMNLGEERPFLDNCGSFHRRAWHLRHKHSTALRLQGLEMQLAFGSQ